MLDAVVRAAHHLGLAAWFGGAWMGAQGMNRATMEVDDHTQRTRVANAGWFHWAPVVAGSVAAHLLAADRLGRLARPGRPTATPLARLRTVTTLGAMGATALTGLAGRRVVAAGDVPVATAVTPLADTPDDVARAQRLLRVTQWAVPATTGVVWVVEAFQETAAERATAPAR